PLTRLTVPVYVPSETKRLLADVLAARVSAAAIVFIGAADVPAALSSPSEATKTARDASPSTPSQLASPATSGSSVEAQVLASPPASLVPPSSSRKSTPTSARPLRTRTRSTCVTAADESVAGTGAPTHVGTLAAVNAEHASSNAAPLTWTAPTGSSLNV